MNCEKHNEEIILYCSICKENVCSECVENHSGAGHALLSKKNQNVTKIDHLLKEANEKLEKLKTPEILLIEHQIEWLNNEKKKLQKSPKSPIEWLNDEKKKLQKSPPSPILQDVQIFNRSPLDFWKTLHLNSKQRDIEMRSYQPTKRVNSVENPKPTKKSKKETLEAAETLVDFQAVESKSESTTPRVYRIKPKK